MKQFLIKATIKEVAAEKGNQIKRHIFAETEKNALDKFKNELKNHDNLLDWKDLELQGIEEVKK